MQKDIFVQLNQHFQRVDVKEYAQNLKVKYREDATLWQESILPKQKAMELMLQTGNDYSLIWHEHCECCWITIDKHSHEYFYLGEDGSVLCEQCYCQLKNNCE